jgi:two-component system, chemotaxis family, chemotaxis protein CheY
MPKTVLLVDDSASIRQVTVPSLRGAGFQVLEAEDGLQALERMKTHAINLVVCDLNMPKLDGMGFLKQMRALPSHRFTPLVFLTTESRDARKDEGRANGATAWITKPCPPSKLVDVVKRLCV